MQSHCKVIQLDHLVLTIQNIEQTVEFYTKALGMSVVHFGQGRTALQFGTQKINLHQVGKEFEPHAQTPTSGSADLCFVTQESLDTWIEHLSALNIPIIEGPVLRTGAVGPMTSIYVRDPDQNLIEIAYYSQIANLVFTTSAYV